jgi:long-subunit acyl-CoA synthetase (AMP-forming)
VGIKSATVGTSKLSKEAAKQLSEMGINVSNCYGLTENLWTAALSDSQDNSRGNNPPMAALVGNRYKVVDQNGDEVEGSVREGQLCFQAPSVMIGYQQRNTEEAKLLNVDAIRGTWLYTGDIFRIEDQGKDKDLLLTFLRRKDGHNPVAKVVATKISIEVAAEAPKEPPPPSDTETK